MSRQSALFAALILGVGCGSPTPPAPGLSSFFPKADEVSGYSENTAVGKAGAVDVAKSGKEAEALIDGDAAPFIEKGMIGFGWESYVASNYKADVRVWQFKAATDATDTYGHLVANVSLYKANTWTDLAGVGEAARLADTGSSYWLNARKGAYLVEVKLTPKDTKSRADVEAFGKAVAGKVP